MKMNYLNSDKLLNTVSNPVWRRFTMTLIGMCVGVIMSFGQTVPASQTLPYIQNFGNSTATYADCGTCASSSLISAAGISLQRTGTGARVATLANAISGNYNSGDFLVTLTGLPSVSRFHSLESPIGEVKLLMGASSTRGTAVVLAINTSGSNTIKLEYEVSLLEHATGQSIGTQLQFRVGNTGSFTGINTGYFDNTFTTVGGVLKYSIALPTEISNQGLVQLRWINFFGTTGFPSMGLDNISITGTPMPSTNLKIVSVLPTDKYTNVDLSAVVTSYNDAGIPSPVVSATGVSLSVLNAISTISGVFTGTIPAGATSVTIGGFRLTSATGVQLIASTTSGIALMQGTSSGFNVNPPLPAFVVSVTGVSPAFANFVAGQPITVGLSTYSSIGTPGSVVGNTVFSLVGVNASLAGNTLVTLTGGMNMVSATGLFFTTSATGAGISVVTVSGDAISGSTYASTVNVKVAPSILAISTLSGIARSTDFSLVITASNVLGELLPLSNNLTLSLVVASGTGQLNTSTAIILAGKFDLTITGLKYNKAENGVSIAVQNAGFSTATTNVFSVTGPPLPTEGFTQPTPRPLPYFQDFGTDISVWNDVTNPSESILPFGLVVARQAATVFRTFDDAALSNYNATGFVGGASVNPATYTGGNIGLRIETRETRGEALLLSVKTSGYENVKLSYTIVPELITAAGVYSMVAQVRIGTSGFYSNIAGSEFVSTGAGVVLGAPINYNLTLPSAIGGQSVVNIRWIRWHNSVANSTILDNISVSGTKTDYLSITTPVKGFVGDAVNLTITAFNKSGALKTVSGATIVTITGNLSLSGITVATIAGGSSSVIVSGLIFGSAKKSASLQAIVVSGDAFGAAASKLFNVSGIPAAFKVLKVQPLGNIQIGKSISVEVELVDANGNNAFSKTNINVTAGVVGGTGALTGTTTGTFMALKDSIITIKFFSYDKAESGIKFSVNGGSLIQGLSDTLSVRADALAGISILYSEDFEKTVKAAIGNPAIPAGMKMFNLDGQTAVTATYPKYLKEAWVIVRVPQERFLGRGSDLGTTPTYWSNVNSSTPDSNYIAYSTSWFNDNTKAADRWIVTPAIKMEGSNFKLNFQAKSSTSSGNYKDRLEVRAAQIFNGNSIDIADWDALPVKNLATGLDSNSHLVSTRVVNFEYKFIDNLVKDITLYLAFRLVTPADKGDRVSIDNIYVTAGGVTSIEGDKASKLGLYPNPATETISLSFNTKSTSPATVSILSATGTVAAVVSLGELASGNHTKQVDVKAIPSGFYMVKVQTGTGVFVTKFLKQ